MGSRGVPPGRADSGALLGGSFGASLGGAFWGILEMPGCLQLIAGIRILVRFQTGLGPFGGFPRELVSGLFGSTSVSRQKIHIRPLDFFHCVPFVNGIAPARFLGHPGVPPPGREGRAEGRAWQTKQSPRTFRERSANFRTLFGGSWKCLDVFIKNGSVHRGMDGTLQYHHPVFKILKHCLNIPHMPGGVWVRR